MMPAIKSEFRKLFTVRSTYVNLALALALEVFFALYVTGYKADAAALRDPSMLVGEAVNAISALAPFSGIVAILLVTHEYRYNTIMYTLTASKRRSYVLLAKLLVITVFAVLFSVIFSLMSPWLATIGVHLHHHTLVHQTFHVQDVLGRTILYGWGYSMFALIIALIARVQVGAIVALFLIPSMVEGLVGLLLKHNQVYLPFASLGAVLNKGFISYAHAAQVAGAYIVGGLIVAWVLFLRRDAN